MGKGKIKREQECLGREVCVFMFRHFSLVRLFQPHELL